MAHRGALCSCLLLLAATSCFAEAPALAAPSYTTSLISDDFEHPVALLPSPDRKDTLYVVERDGTVEALRNGKILGDELLDISGAVNRAQRHRLMAIAFHPDFAKNRLFYAYFVDVQGDAVVAQFGAKPDETPDVDSLTITVKFAQPFPTQNGGWLAFGPDRLLYVSTANGGERGDAASPSTLLGKILRISPTEAGGYKTPHDNPSRSEPGSSQEVWASGFSSPDSFAFSSPWTKLFVIDSRGDAGAIVSLVSAGGSPASSPTYTAPRGEALVGGVACSPCSLPSLHGQFVLADSSTGKVFSLFEISGKLARQEIASVSPGKITAIGLSEKGSLVVATDRGTLTEITEAGPSTTTSKP